MATLHRQDDPELGVAAHHARISLGHFFQRIAFNHAAHASEFGETDGLASGPAFGAGDLRFQFRDVEHDHAPSLQANDAAVHEAPQVA